VGTRIVYTRRDFANDEIAEVDPSGAAERRVTTYPGYDGHPAWGPNGTLAFTRELADGSNRIYELDVDGSLHALVDLPIDQDEVSWSPDGSRIAFIADVPPWRIFVLTVATGEVRALDTYGGERSDWDPAWSPDGRWIAFASSRGDSYDLFVYDTVGGGLRRLTSGLHDEWCPSWSPDGQTIVFAGDEKGTFGIWAVPARGGTPRQLTRVAHGNDYHPTWSPDGTLIAFDRTLEDETEAIYTVRPDGTSLHRVTQSPEPAYEPAWQAAGRGREALTQ
jgi:TolB protein